MPAKISFELKKEFDQDLSRALAIYMDAFENEPVTNVLIDLSDSSTKAAYHNLMEEIIKSSLKKSGYEFYIVKYDERVAGFAAITFPATSLGSKCLPLLKAGPQMLKHLRYSKVIDYLKTFPDRSLAEDKVVLEILAVDQNLQGRGIGKTFLKFLTRLFDRRQYDLYLTTGRVESVRLYQRFNFELMNDHTTKDGLTIYEMVRFNQ